MTFKFKLMGQAALLRSRKKWGTIENDMKLITNNQKDFSSIPDLDFESRV